MTIGKVNTSGIFEKQVLTLDVVSVETNSFLLNFGIPSTTSITVVKNGAILEPFVDFNSDGQYITFTTPPLLTDRIYIIFNGLQLSSNRIDYLIPKIYTKTGLDVVNHKVVLGSVEELSQLKNEAIQVQLNDSYLIPKGRISDTPLVYTENYQWDLVIENVDDVPSNVIVFDESLTFASTDIISIFVHGAERTTVQDISVVGKTGNAGLSAYEVWLETFEPSTRRTHTVDEFLASLRGATGTTGEEFASSAITIGETRMGFWDANNNNDRATLLSLGWIFLDGSGIVNNVPLPSGATIDSNDHINKTIYVPDLDVNYDIDFKELYKFLWNRLQFTSISTGTETDPFFDEEYGIRVQRWNGTATEWEDITSEASSLYTADSAWSAGIKILLPNMNGKLIAGKTESGNKSYTGKVFGNRTLTYVANERHNHHLGSLELFASEESSHTHTIPAHIHNVSSVATGELLGAFQISIENLDHSHSISGVTFGTFTTSLESEHTHTLSDLAVSTEMFNHSHTIRVYGDFNPTAGGDEIHDHNVYNESSAGYVLPGVSAIQSNVPTANDDGTAYDDYIIKPASTNLYQGAIDRSTYIHTHTIQGNIGSATPHSHTINLSDIPSFVTQTTGLNELIQHSHTISGSTEYSEQLTTDGTSGHNHTITATGQVGYVGTCIDGDENKLYNFPVMTQTFIIAYALLPSKFQIIIDNKENLINKIDQIRELINIPTSIPTAEITYPTERAVRYELDLKEDLINKTTTIRSIGTATDTLYPTERAVSESVYNALVDAKEYCDEKLGKFQSIFLYAVASTSATAGVFSITKPTIESVPTTVPAWSGNITPTMTQIYEFNYTAPTDTIIAGNNQYNLKFPYRNLSTSAVYQAQYIFTVQHQDLNGGTPVEIFNVTRTPFTPNNSSYDIDFSVNNDQTEDLSVPAGALYSLEIYCKVQSGTGTLSLLVNDKDNNCVLSRNEKIGQSSATGLITFARGFEETQENFNQYAYSELNYVGTTTTAIDSRVQTLELNSITTPSVVNSTSTTPTFDVEDNTVYTFTNSLTSLTIGTVEKSYLESKIIFTTGSTISEPFLSATSLANKWVGEDEPEFEASSEYIICIWNGYAVCGKIGE